MPIKSQELQYELMQTAGVFGRLKETNLIFEGEEAYTDGKNIVLPAMPEGVDIPDDRAMVMRGYLDHEAGHIRHTDFPFWMGTLKAGISPTLKNAWNSTEDLFLEERVIEEYRGAEKNLGHLASYVNEKEYGFLKGQDTTPISPENVTCAMRAWGRLKRSKSDYTQKLFDLFPENVKEWAEHYARRSWAAKDTKETFQIALDLLKKLKEDPELKTKPEDEQEGQGKPEDGEGVPKTTKDAKAAAEAAGEGGKPEEVREYGKGKGKGVAGGKDGGKVDRFMEPSEIAKDIFGGSGSTFKHHGISGGKPYIVTSKTMDETYHRSRPARKAMALHTKMQRASPIEYEKVKSRIGGQVNTMKARLKRSLAAKELRDWDFGRQEGRLDTKRLVAASQGAENVYKKRAERLELDTSVHMLIDLSGSMSGSKMRTAAECAIAFSECLEGSPIKYQVSGFSNRGEGANPSGMTQYSRFEALQTYVFKSFGESLHVAKPAMSCLPAAAGGNNSDYDALMWAYQDLIKQPSKRKVLLVFSDGQPANNTTYGYEHLNFHAKEAIKYIQSRGVEVIGIGIQTNHLKHFYQNFVEINKMEDLAGAMFNKLANALVAGKVRL